MEPHPAVDIAGEPLLRMVRISKSFPGVQALQDVDLELQSGEVLALLGENGAGKSTLIKVLSGAHRPDSGEVRIHGRRHSISGPADAQRAGVAVMYQEFNLVPFLTARENIFLGQDRSTLGFLRHGLERRLARELFTRIGVEVDVDAPARELSIAQQQVVEIAKALSLDARIFVMDEPSATLTLQEVDRLFAIIRELKARGIGVIYISHRLDEIFDIADRVTVLRDGRGVATRRVADVGRKELIELMVGRKLEHEFPKEPAAIGEERLVVKDLTRGSVVRGVSFSVRRGEIVGLTGLVGAGRTETARLIFGADRRDRGTIWLDGRRLRIRRPRQAIQNGICLMSEDRKSEGLVLSQSARANFALPNLQRFSAVGFVKGRRERHAFSRHVDGLRIRLTDHHQRVANLSGGNQQKIVLAKWLERNCEAVIFDEPTRGIDIGSKYEIYLLMSRLARRGKAILMISSELPEVLGMSDRIIVLHKGRIRGELKDVSRATQKDIMELAVG